MPTLTPLLAVLHIATAKNLLRVNPAHVSHLVPTSTGTRIVFFDGSALSTLTPPAEVADSFGTLGLVRVDKTIPADTSDVGFVFVNPLALTGIFSYTDPEEGCIIHLLGKSGGIRVEQPTKAIITLFAGAPSGDNAAKAPAC